MDNTNDKINMDNISNKMTIIQLNKGKSDFINSIHNIGLIIQKYNPHIFILNEANLHIHDDISVNMFPHYQMEIDNLRATNGNARTVILIHETVNYTRYRKLESPLISTVWLKIHMKGYKDFFIQGLYRQWEILNKLNTHTIKAQIARFRLIIKKWKETAMCNEVITLGDINLNSFSR